MLFRSFRPVRLADLVEQAGEKGLPPGERKRRWYMSDLKAWAEMVGAEISLRAGSPRPDTRLLLTWEEVREMSSHGIWFGSHSRSHRILTQIPLDEAEEEIHHSRDDLLSRSIRFSPVFCYPNGDYNDSVQQIVRKCGYHAAVGTRFGFENETPRDLFGLTRIGVHNDITSTIPLFAFHLSGMIK